MEKQTKDFKVVIDLVSGVCKLIYIDKNNELKEFASYEIVGTKITDTYNTSVDLALIRDIENLTKTGFRYNPYLIDNN